MSQKSFTDASFMYSSAHPFLGDDASSPPISSYEEKAKFLKASKGTYRQDDMMEIHRAESQRFIELIDALEALEDIPLSFEVYKKVKPVIEDNVSNSPSGYENLLWMVQLGYLRRLRGHFDTDFLMDMINGGRFGISEGKTCPRGMGLLCYDEIERGDKHFKKPFDFDYWLKASSRYNYRD